jgi:hypothetical protein
MGLLILMMLLSSCSPSNQITGNVLQERFPELTVSVQVPSEIVAQKDSNTVRMIGVENPDTISAIRFREEPGMATDVVQVDNVKLQNATIRLKKHGSVEAIGICEGDPCTWQATEIPFIDQGDHIEFTVSHFTSYGGIPQSGKLFMRAQIAVNGVPTLNSTQNGTGKSIGIVTASTTLFSLVNASESNTRGRIVRTIDIVNFTGYWATASNVNTAYATYKLMYGVSAPTSLVCQHGDDSTGGIKLPAAGTSAWTLLRGNCSPSTNITIPDGTKLWYVVNLYANNTGGGGAATKNASFCFDNTTCDTWTNVSSYLALDMNMTFNQTNYTTNDAINVSGYLRWVNGTLLTGKNVTVAFYNSSRDLRRIRNMTTDGNGFYNDTFSLGATPDYGQWSVNLTGWYDAETYVTNSSNITVYYIAPSTPPNVASATVSPTPTATTANDLACVNGSVSDSDDDIVTLHYNWFRNGTSLTALNWPMSSNGTHTFDISTNNRHGILDNVTMITSGAVGTAFRFTPGSAINISQQTLFLGPNNMTLSVWVNMTTNTGDRHIIGNGDCAGDIVVNQARQGIYFSYPGCKLLYSARGSLNDSQWHHIAIVLNHTNLSIYVDGVFDNSTAVNLMGGGEYIGLLQVGARGNNVNFFTGSVDELIYFRRAMNAEEIWYLNLTKNKNLGNEELRLGEVWNCSITPVDSKGLNGTMRYSSNTTIIPDLCTPSAGANWNIDAANTCAFASVNYSVKNITITGSGTITFSNVNISSTGCTIQPSAGGNISVVITPPVIWSNPC